MCSVRISFDSEGLDRGLNKAQQREAMICPPMFFAQLIWKKCVLPCKAAFEALYADQKYRIYKSHNRQNALAWLMAVYTTY